MSFKSSFTVAAVAAVAAISLYLVGGTTPAYADLGDQLFKLLANDGAAEDSFGVSVAISGTIAIVGAPRDDDNGDQSGSAYLFDTTTGEQIAKLLPNDGAAGDQFGWFVGISGTTLLVGTCCDDDNGSGSGSAYLFDAAPGKCPWDLDGNGSVGILDLLALLAVWGTDPGGPPDFDGDGIVSILDLLALLANWGPCA